MKDTYTINDLAMISGLSTRTIRNYIKMGLLQGEKLRGKWQFSPEQVDALMAHPAISASIRTKRDGVVLDFLFGRGAKHNRICTILDLPEEDGEAVSAFFLARSADGSLGSSFQFSFDDTCRYPRVILQGQLQEITKLLNAFAQSRGAAGEKS